MDAILTAALAYSSNLGAQWARGQAIEVARAHVVELADMMEAHLSLRDDLGCAPRAPTGGYYDPAVMAHRNAEWARYAPARALREAARWFASCESCPEHLAKELPGQLARLKADGVPVEGITRARALAEVVMQPPPPLVMDAPEPPPGPIRWDGDERVDPRVTPAVPGGWRVFCRSGWPHSADYTWSYVYQGAPVVDVDEEGRITWHPREKAVAEKAAAKAKAKASHDAYKAQLDRARVVIDADPALREAVATLYAHHGETVRLYGPAVEAAGHAQGHPAVPTEEPGRSAALALAYVGWGWCPGQEGGVLLIPGGVPVGVRGALRLPREVACG